MSDQFSGASSDAGPGSPYDIRSEIGAIAAPVAPQAGEAVIVKHYPNSFIGTDLERRLQEAGIENVILAGFMTHMCINSTARGAFNLGFKPTVVARATATRDLPTADGGVVAAADLQRASLAALGVHAEMKDVDHALRTTFERVFGRETVSANDPLPAP